MKTLLKLLIGSSLLSAGCIAPSDGAGTMICTQRATGILVCASTSPQTRNPPVAPILGQASATTSLAADGANGMTQPSYVASDGVRFAVSDTGNNRVLLWNSVPSYLNQPADLVIGQPTMTAIDTNQGGAVGAGTLNLPQGVAIAGGKLFVVDSANNRLLIWNTWPTANGQSADVVVGQPTFVLATSNLTTQTSLWGPNHVTVDSNSRMYITDAQNNRILYYASVPTTSGAAATFVIGQPTFVAFAASTTQSGLSTPTAASASGNYLAVADSTNSRVVIYSSPPTANGASATAVLGQSTFLTAATTCAAGGMWTPFSVFIKSTGALYVTDTTNNRILRWPSVAAITNGQAPDNVFGQPDLVSCSTSASGPTQTNLSSPTDAFSDAYGNLWVVDTFNNRVTANSWL